MRIVGGIYRSRKINMVGIETTRETSDMVREAVFNLMSLIPVEGVGLDLFSGSGAMGLEAISRGLSFCYFNDVNKQAFKTTKDNIKLLKVEDKTKCFNLDFHQALNAIDRQLDFIFLDPPYKLDCIKEVIDIMNKKDLLKDNSVIICEISSENNLDIDDSFEIYKERKYGIKKIIILRRKNSVS